MVAALAADEDRDYGELELDDSIVSLLIKFEEIAFEVSTEEWKQGIEAAPEINFSAAAAAKPKPWNVGGCGADSCEASLDGPLGRAVAGADATTGSWPDEDDWLADAGAA